MFILSANALISARSAVVSSAWGPWLCPCRNLITAGMACSILWRPSPLFHLPQVPGTGGSSSISLMSELNRRRLLLDFALRSLRLLRILEGCAFFFAFLGMFASTCAMEHWKLLPTPGLHYALVCGGIVGSRQYLIFPTTQTTQRVCTLHQSPTRIE